MKICGFICGSLLVLGMTMCNSFSAMRETVVDNEAIVNLIREKKDAEGHEKLGQSLLQSAREAISDSAKFEAIMKVFGYVVSVLNFPPAYLVDHNKLEELAENPLAREALLLLARIHGRVEGLQQEILIAIASMRNNGKPKEPAFEERLAIKEAAIFALHNHYNYHKKIVTVK
ncbi:hypothetical protein FACS189449_11990 [Alphaproteobacteria bacterium]|nr:hypothetical protein FACS189449_11990 [Alphaproteobacteria bacterium]